MLITVIATLCLANVCQEKIVTDQASLASCTSGFAQQALAGWMAENGYTARGYRLVKWGCVIGGKRNAA